MPEITPEHHDLVIFANEIADRLNAQIIRLLGDDADWQHWSGRTDIPKCFDLTSKDESLLTELWILREGANGICASNDY